MFASLSPHKLLCCGTVDHVGDNILTQKQQSWEQKVAPPIGNHETGKSKKTWEQEVAHTESNMFPQTFCTVAEPEEINAMG